MDPGELVRVTYQNESLEGILLPSFEKDVILLKLKNGYNMGFPEKEVRIEVVKKAGPPAPQKPSPVIINPALPTIAILHTGGTIASRVDYRTGAVTSAFSPSELLALFPELGNIANIESELISQMWSDELRFPHFALIAQRIEAQVKKGVKGIIIGMGTDNLAVAAAALAFIVEQSPIPILLVGAQRSSDRGSSDAAMNLICAAEFIKQTDFTGVAICMHGSSSDDFCHILPATKTAKLHTSRRNAFQAVNDELIATVDYKTRIVTPLIISLVTSLKAIPFSPRELIIKPKMEEKVGLLKIHINMFPEQFSFFKGWKGLIIEGTGLGHTPGQVPNHEAEIHRKIYPAIKEVIDSGCVVVMTSQCLFGRVNMNVYDKGRDLLKFGVISGGDMLPNTAFIKLAWLLGNYPKKEVEKLILENLRGEINERLKYDEKIVEI